MASHTVRGKNRNIRHEIKQDTKPRSNASSAFKMEGNRKNCAPRWRQLLKQAAAKVSGHKTANQQKRATTPLPRSPNRTREAMRAPTVRKTFVVPILWLPYCLISMPQMAFTNTRPQGMDPMKYPIRAPNNTLIPMRLPYGSVIFILTAYNEIDGRSLESKGFPQLIFKVTLVGKVHDFGSLQKITKVGGLTLTWVA